MPQLIHIDLKLLLRGNLHFKIDRFLETLKISLFNEC